MSEATRVKGPYPPGRFSDAGTGTRWERTLVRGQRYRVVKPFEDFDGRQHVLGEEWDFLGSSFAPCDDGLSIFVADDDRQQWQIRLCWREELQAEVCENFAVYVQPVESS